jgi:hypothetical protein
VKFFASRRLFEWSGCECQCSKSGRQAVELLKRQEFNIVLNTHKIAYESRDPLITLLLESRASLSYSMATEKGFG